jgi:hypothetical protein
MLGLGNGRFELDVHSYILTGAARCLSEHLAEAKPKG